MVFPATPIDIFVEVALDADLTGSPSDWAWTDATDYVLTRDGITITRGGRDGGIQSPPSTCVFTVDNADGRWVPTNPTGAWYGQLRKNTPVRIRTNESSSSVRWTGFLSSLPPRWDPSESHRYVPVTASGILQRLQRGQTPLRSPLVRAITSMTVDSEVVSPVAYWPGEDGSNATSLAEFSGGPAMILVGQVVTLADDSPGGSGPLPEFTTVSGVTGNVPNHPATGEWSIACVLNFPATPVAAGAVLMRWFTSGSYPLWQITLSPGSPDTWALEAYDTTGTQQINESTNFEIGGVEQIGLWVLVQANARQSGTSVIYSAAVHNAFGGTQVSGVEPTITPGVISQVRVHAHSRQDGMHAGHWAVWDRVLDSVIDPGAVEGFDGDSVTDRVGRLSQQSPPAESVVQVEFDFVNTMGPQPQATRLDVYREAEAVANGRLVEARDPTTFNAFMELYTHDALANQDAALILDHDAGQLSIPFEPTDDDQQVKNDVTATRSGGSGTGSSARVIATLGEHSGLTPDTVGTYDDSVTVNVELDSQLPHQAGWRVNIGTVEGLRLPVVTLDLARNTSLIPDWIGCDIGSRVQITNPPTGLAPDDIDLLVEGWVETFGPYTWTAQLNCSPYAPWRVFQIAEDAGDTDPYLGRLAGDPDCALRLPIDDNDLSMDVDPNYYRWTTATDDFPVNVRLGGEVVTVSAIALNSATFIAVGAASHADNAAVTPALYAGHTGDHLIVVVAAIRSSGTGTLQTPTDYTRLPIFAESDNVQVFAKIHDGSESNPTVTPSGGAAGDTVSAFTFGLGNISKTFADLGGIVVDSIAQLNASAANIAYGGLYSWQVEGCVQLIIGWKQDDFTSVAPPAGFTEMLEASTITGNDQSLYCAYRIDTTPALVPEGSLAVTGGTSTSSRSAVVAIAGGKQIFTLSARSVNGVTKSHAAGTLIAVEDPAVLAL